VFVKQEGFECSTGSRAAELFQVFGKGTKARQWLASLLLHQVSMRGHLADQIFDVSDWASRHPMAMISGVNLAHQVLSGTAYT
jgi:hypothetical protein